MSSFLAVGAVSAVLRRLLEGSVARHELASVLGADPVVSASPPDRIQTGQGTPDRINLFLFQATENAAWRNMEYPSRNGRGDRTGNPKLALDLHYLITAYGARDYNAEVLLGYAMFVMHETPVLTRQVIRQSVAAWIGGVDLNEGDALTAAEQRALASAEKLADQIEQIKITPRVLNVEEVSKIWTALQSQYRTTAAYQVTVVLIEAEQAARSPLPVLTRGLPVSGGDEGVFVQSGLQPPVPTLESLRLPTEQQPSIRPGEVLSLRGHHLAGVNPRARFRLVRGTDVWELDAEPGANDSHINVVIPLNPPGGPGPASLDPDNWRVGLYEVTGLVTQAGRTRETNSIRVVLAPRLTAPVTSGGVPASVQVACMPPIRPNQSAVLMLGQRELRANAFNAPAKNLSFTLPTGSNALPAGTYPVRLQVDEIETLVLNYSAQPPQFDAAQALLLP